MKLFQTGFLLAIGLGLLATVLRADDMPSPDADLTLWYAKPANNPINEGLPIGNAQIGGLILGGTANERIVLNEDSLWTGNENPSGGYEATNFGAYQVLGNLLITLPGHDQNVSNYRRDLDLKQALAHVSYDSNGVHYQREYFCSHPAGVMVVRLTADKPGSYSGTIELNDSRQDTTQATDNGLSFASALPNDLKYEAQLVAVNDGGTLQAADGKISFQNCDSLTIVFAAGTNYAMDYAKGYRGDDPHDRLTQTVKAASAQTYDALKSAHVQDFQSLFDRVSLDLGTSSADQKALPFDQRKVKAAQTEDPELEALFFQYGRYLLISSSRPGGLPANLQGLWNDSNSPEWHCDYHSNINVEMNYWPAESTNLAECHLPFFNLVQSQLEPWRKATALSNDYKTQTGDMTSRGFAIRTSHNIFGGMGWNWDKTANAWYCQHFWEHYAFGLDKDYLATVAYPVMKETCQFWEDHLKTLPDGRLVVPNGWSPEHGPTQDGVSYNQEIVWDLFNNYVAACDALGVDPDYRDKIAGLRDKLVTPGIGSWGQLLEWMTELHDPNQPELDTPNDHHRHTSHLFAVYPGTQITMKGTPELAKAAKVSLDARGDTGDVREWSFAWRTALYARLHDSAGAHRELQQLFSDRNTCLNLFGLHPPMQMDGNFGSSAAIAEMLLQSQTGDINLLPALPAEWPTGSVTGLRARGGFTVDLAWENGQLSSATLHSVKGTDCRLLYGDKEVNVHLGPGLSVTLNGQLQKKS
jgi:alpha-L-fucosidase 2